MIEDFIKNRLVHEERNVRIYFPRKGGFTGKPLAIINGKIKYFPPDEKDFKYLLRWWFRTALSRKELGRRTYKELEKDKLMTKLFGSTEKQSGLNIKINYDGKYIAKVEETYQSMYSNLKNKLLEQEFIQQLSQLVNCMNQNIEFQPRLRCKFFNDRIELRVMFKSNDKHACRSAIFQVDGLTDNHIIKVGDIPRIILLSTYYIDRDKLKQSTSYDKILDEVILNYLSTVCIPKEIMIKNILIYANQIIENKELVKILTELSLTLGSVGSISNRGFGSIVLSKTNNIEIEKISEIIKELLRLVGVETPINPLDPGNGLPKVPTLDLPNGVFHVHISDKTYLSNYALKKINEAYVKRKNKNLRNSDVDTCLLGIPRKDCPKGRRISSIASKIIPRHNFSNYVNILTYGFLSSDVRLNRNYKNGDLKETFSKTFEAVTNFF